MFMPFYCFLIPLFFDVIYIVHFRSWDGTIVKEGYENWICGRNKDRNEWRI